MKYLHQFNQFVQQVKTSEIRSLYSNGKILGIKSVGFNLNNIKVNVMFFDDEIVNDIQLYYTYDEINLSNENENNEIDDVLSHFFDVKDERNTKLIDFLEDHQSNYSRYIIVGLNNSRLEISNVTYDGLYRFTATIYDDKLKFKEEVIVSQDNLVGWSSVDSDLFSQHRQIYLEEMLSPFFKF